MSLRLSPRALIAPGFLRFATLVAVLLVPAEVFCGQTSPSVLDPQVMGWAEHSAAPREAKPDFVEADALRSAGDAVSGDWSSSQHLISAAAPAAQAMLREVLARNPELARLRAEAKAAEAAVVGVTSWPDPMVSATAFVLTPETRVGPQRWSVGLQQQLPWFGKLALRERQALARAVAAGLAVEARAVELVTQARDLLFEIAYVDLEEGVMREDRAALSRYEELARARYSSGGGAQQPVIKLQAEISRLDQRLVDVATRRSILASRLNALGDHSAGAPLPSVALGAVPSGSELSQLSHEKLRATALEARPEVARWRALIAGAEAGVELAAKEYRPDLNLGFSYIAVSGRDDQAARLNPPPGNGDDVFGLNLSVRLPVHRRRLAADAEQAAAQQLAAEESLRAVEATIERDLGDHLARLDGLGKQYDLVAGLLIPQAEESLRSAEVAYATGLLGALDLLDAERTLLNARVSLARLRTDVAATMNRIEGVTGTPLELRWEDEP